MRAADVARRVLDALPTVDDRVVVRDRCGRAEFAEAVAAEARRRGLDPVIEWRSNEVLVDRLANSTVADWSDEACAARNEFTFDASATVTLGGWQPDLSVVDPAVTDAWLAALRRADRRWSASGMLALAVAVPGPCVAAALGTTVEALDSLVLPAVCCPAGDLRAATAMWTGRLAAGERHMLATPGCLLWLNRGGRRLHVDDGMIDAADAASAAVVSNLPGGSVYWTVLEDAARGDVRLADGSVLIFGDGGRVVDGPFAGERISHLGVGTNPLVGQPLGWTLVDEHRAGAVFLALGENRYMGGQNTSDVNVDLVLAEATVSVA